MNIFITGATGWAGSAVAKELLDAGHRVRGLVRSENSTVEGMDLIRGTLDNQDLLRRAAAEHDFSKFAENAEQDRRAIETLGRALEESDRLLLITAGLAQLAPGRIATEKPDLLTDIDQTGYYAEGSRGEKGRP